MQPNEEIQYIEIESQWDIGEIKKGQYMCPKCNSYKIKIINGREFYVDSLEVD